ncbi:MAG: selenide, water dikinase SelD [Pseudomonadota bacterium]
MKRHDISLTRDLVFIGGGHTHALALHAWAMKPLPGTRVTVINPEPVAAYSGMLPGYIAGHYARDELDIDLIRLARRAGARLIVDRATHIDRAAKRIDLADGPPVFYDLASLDIGITSTLAALEGFSEHGLPAKPLSRFARAWSDYRARPGPKRVAIIGAGVAGAEVAMAIAHALPRAGVALVEKGRAFAALGARAARLLRARIEEHGIDIFEGVTPVRVTQERVMLEDGRAIEANLVIGAAGSNPYEWLRASGLTDDAGFVPVDRFLRSRDAAIFAVGDCAELETPRPKSGVYAVRQAPILFANLQHALSGAGARKPYFPQKDYLKLISLGRKTALGEKWGLSFAADSLWALKDRIDEKFMAKLNQPVPPMRAPLPWPRARGARTEPMMCGGCGSKIGRSALEAALRGGIGGDRADGDDAALLSMSETRQVISTDHLRAFCDDPVLMARIALNHAMGDIWAMGAAPQAALASIILPRQSPELAERAMTELMAAATRAAAATGARIVGGHSTLGAELTIGFTVTGLCARAPITLKGAQPGDALILTKPLGTGVLMAGEMRGRARAWDIRAAWEAMATPQNKAAQLLSDAHAMTDVTGFGLYGHLSGMCRASGVSAEIWLEALPLLAGALELSRQGIRSSLFAENAGEDAQADPLRALIYDPQTSGGLLAAVGDTRVLSELRRAGIDAALIGRVVAGAGAGAVTIKETAPKDAL